MSLKKTILYCFLLLLICSFITCAKKTSDKPAAGVETPALIKIEKAIMYKDDTKADIELNIKLSLWDEVICLNQEAPVKIESTDAATNAVTSKQYYRIKKTDNEKIGLIEKEALLFREDSPKEMLVIKDKCYLFGQPKSGSGLEILPVGEMVTSTGFAAYFDWEKWKTVQFWRVNLLNKIYWVIDDYMMAGATVGIALNDMPLYKRPQDIPSNLEKDLTYNKMDIIPVVSEMKDGWITVLKQNKTNEYFVFAKDAATNPISSNKDDYFIVRHLRDIYLSVKPIVDEGNAAIDNNSDPDTIAAALEKIQNKTAKIQTMSAAIEPITNKLRDYPGTSFKTELDALLESIQKIKPRYEVQLKTENSTDDSDSDAQ